MTARATACAVPVPSARGQAIFEQRLCGWGGIGASRAQVVRPASVEQVVEALARLARGAPGGAIARGAGRSYGDAAQRAGGLVLDMGSLDRIVAIDSERATVTAQAGVSMARALTGLAAHGLTLPVLPGTRHVTVGGAIASDIHGKSHHRDGSLARHVRSLTLCAAGGELLEVSPERDPELFGATLGGMGLTGAVVQATLQAVPLSTPWVRADSDRARDFEHALALLNEDAQSRWSVAWLDLLARGGAIGRGVVSRADPWPAADGDPGARPSLRLAERARAQVPAWMPSGALRPSLVRAFNAARWRRARSHERGRRVALASYLFPLDALGGWNRLYGARGLVQYQMVVPPGREQTLVRCVELLAGRRIPVYLAVLKRFGAFPAGPLSFPIEGFTLALDMPGGAPGLWPALDELDEMVAGAGGRVYLSKDVRLRKDVLSAMYPELHRFLKVRARVDPDGALRSDLSCRLGL